MNATEKSLSRAGRWLVLSVAFLGWMFAGLEMSIIPLVVRPAILSFEPAVESPLSPGDAPTSPLKPSGEAEKRVGNWLAWYTCAFLLGAASGGALFGWLGDRIGRSRAMASAILCYSIFTGAVIWIRAPEELLVLRFLACMGVGGIWPNGVALVSEAWSEVSRPTLAGLIGAAANLGFVLLGMIGMRYAITPDSWRWVFAIGAAPIVLGVFAWIFVPESPEWLATRNAPGAKPAKPMATVFRPPILKYTLIGICLGMIPVLGNWGGANWLVPWADKVAGVADPHRKAMIQILRSSGAAIGSLIGGWLASMLGRRTTYFVISLASLLVSGWIYHFVTPLDGWLFNSLAFALGFVGVAYFGWLPLYLPELFPTAVRATGTGVTFNFGRILAAPGVLGAGWLIQHFGGDYAKVGSITSLIYVVGMVAICFAPDTSKRKLSE